jgi:hypothetical protein
MLPSVSLHAEPTICEKGRNGIGPTDWQHFTTRAKSAPDKKEAPSHRERGGFKLRVPGGHPHLDCACPIEPSKRGEHSARPRAGNHKHGRLSGVRRENRPAVATPVTWVRESGQRTTLSSLSNGAGEGSGPAHQAYP